MLADGHPTFTYPIRVLASGTDPCAQVCAYDSLEAVGKASYHVSRARFRGSDSMPSQKLTAKQHRLKAEIEEIAAFVQMDHWNILDYEEDGRTTYLEMMKIQLVRGDIVAKYTLIDEFLAVDICHYYFRRPKKGFTFREQWKTQRFKVFNHYILDETFLIKKWQLRTL